MESLAQNSLVRQGYDRQGRAFFIGMPRHHRSFEPTTYLIESLYNSERAIACAEASGQEQVTAVLDYAGFHPLHHALPMDVTKRVLQTLRKNKKKL
jgi:hypothetical protein